ncbi:MAG: FecR family protein [Nitrospira sp.]|nr:FecR family protein [Nitrospira sp.]
MSDANPPQSPASLEDEALAWIVRLHAGHATDQDRRTCEAWQHLSPAHQRAFHEASSLWEAIDQVGPALRPAARTVRLAASQSRRWWPRLRSWSLVACFLLMIGWFSWQPLFNQIHVLAADHRTAIGQQAQVVLQDGTQLILNTDTALNVVFSPQRREVSLLKGEAAFVVAPDSTRPFSVRSGDTVITALGTKFVMQTRSGSITVTVAEHAVQVVSSISPATTPLVVREGQQVSYSPEKGWSQVQPVDAIQASAWQRGKMIFEAQPLGAVVADLNRYRHGHIAILNPSLRSLPVTGVFQIDEPDAALRAIEQTLGIHDTSFSSYFVFLH